MSITPPDITPIQVPTDLITYHQVTDVVPFTYRSSMTYQQLLEGLRHYLIEDFGPWVHTEFSEFGMSWVENVQNVIAAVNTALTNQATDVEQQLATTLAEIVAGANANLNDGHVLAALELANSVSLAYLDGRYLKISDGESEYLTRATADATYAPKPTAFGFYLLAGSGIDLTGQTDSTVAVNAFFAALNDGASVVTPANAIIAVSDSIMNTKRVHWSGSGEIRWTAGVTNKPMIEATAAGSNYDGLYLTNPNHLAGQTGNKSAGIHITNNSVRVEGCTIVGAQQAIFVDAQGEWHDFIIMRNHILDVPGSGDGPSSASNNGEDRGDGIYVMGAGAVIVGNIVTALDGTDARIGIGIESLANLEAVPYVHGDSMFTISNNRVTGKFRRGIVNEGCKYVTIADNTIADFTWWAIALIGTAWQSNVHHNTIASTRSSTDLQGSAWNPNRCGIMIFDNVANATVDHNAIAVEGNGVLQGGIVVQVGTLGQSTDLVIDNNQIDGSSSNLITTGILSVNGATRIKVTENTIKGFSTNGVYLSGDSGKCRVSGNKIYGSGKGTGRGIYTDNTPSIDGEFNWNHIENVGNAIDTFGRTGSCQWIGNTIEHAAHGLDFFGAVAPIVMQVNMNTANNDVTNGYNNVPTDNGSTIRVGNISNF